MQYILPALASASNLVDRLLDGYVHRTIFKITFAGYLGRPEFCKRKIESGIKKSEAVKLTADEFHVSNTYVYRLIQQFG